MLVGTLEECLLVSSHMSFVKRFPLDGDPRDLQEELESVTWDG